MWFTENPWPPMLLCILGAAIFFFAWTRNGSMKSLFAGVLCVAATAGVYFLEQAIVTEPEVIEQLIGEVSDSVISGDVDKTLSYISKQSPEIGLAVMGAMKLVTIEDDLSITDSSVEMLSEGSQAKIHFRANGTVRVESANYRNHYPSRWEVTWQREANEWKITRIARLNVINGDEIGMLSK